MCSEKPGCPFRLITLMHSISKYLDRIGSRAGTSQKSCRSSPERSLEEKSDQGLFASSPDYQPKSIDWDQALREEHLLYQEPLIYYGQRFWATSWVRSMRRYIELNEIKDDQVMLIIPRLLGGEALTWYKSQPRWVDPEQVFQQILERFVYLDEKYVYT